MKKKKYFVVGDGASQTYYTKKEVFKDLPNFIPYTGDGVVYIYSLNKGNNYDLFKYDSSDLVGIYKIDNGKGRYYQTKEL